jgi:hypothetical protein
VTEIVLLPFSACLHLVQLAEFEHGFVELQSFASLISLLDVFTFSVVVKVLDHDLDCGRRSAGQCGGFVLRHLTK